MSDLTVFARKTIFTLAAGGIFTLGLASSASAAPVSAGSDSSPDIGATQTANLAIQGSGGAADTAIRESNQSARTAVMEAFGR